MAQQMEESLDEASLDLFRYAFIWVGKSYPGKPNMLEAIEGRAMPERWGFDGDRSILQSYLAQTFRKLMLDGLVFESADGGFSAFNTGLVTPEYDDLYLCFEPNRNPGRQPWYCLGVCTQYDNREGELSSRLRDACAQMPERASYFRDLEDVVFDPTRHVAANWEHIVVDNVGRQPCPVVSRHLHDAPGWVRDSIPREPEQWDKGALAGVREFLRGSREHRQRFVDHLEGACRRSVKRCEYCYRIAVPSYYPKLGRVQTLLPLYLQSEQRPDVALVLGRDGQGNYEGRTILTMRMAYNNARLLCKPESSWLEV